MPNESINTLQHGLYNGQRSLCGQIMKTNNISVQFKVRKTNVFTH